MSSKLIKLFLIVLSFSLYYVVINPLYTGSGTIWSPEQSVSSLRDLSSQYDVILAQADVLSKQADSLRSQYSRVNDDVKSKVKIMIPDSIDPPRLISEMNAVANQSGLVLTDISYSQTTSAANPLRGAYTVTFNVKTNYTKFKELMRSYETSLRLFNIQLISFSAPTKETDLITFQVKLETYYLK